MEREKMQERFMQDIADHEMTIIRDEGVHRHLRFKRPKTMAYYFDVITWPGSLCIHGDCGTYVFSRTEDMFNFFKMDRNDFNHDRTEGLQINPYYWEEKLQAADMKRRGIGGTREYSQEKFQKAVKDRYDDFYMHSDSPDKEVWERLEDEVLWAESEESAHRAAAEFEHNGFDLVDFWENDLTEYTFGFIWNLFAIAYCVREYENSQQKVAA